MNTIKARPQQVLVVDRDLPTGQMYRDILEQHGYVVEVVQTGMAALAALTTREDQPQAVIIDAVLPDMTGQAVIDHSRAVRGDLPVLLITATDDAPQLARAMGVTAWLIKPVAVLLLVQRLAELLAENSTT